ncbi:MAG: acyl-ACP--UDP-N-acetylglucosamine O-acyltransferase [Planctomycetota bacterium]
MKCKSVDIIPFKQTESPQVEDTPPVISPLASVDPNAEIAPGVEIGPFCVIGPKAKIGKRTRLLNSVTVMGDVTIGEDNVVSPGAVLGGAPQDISYKGSDTKVTIGDRNIIRECVTINLATEKEDGFTRIGSDCYFMGNVHIAHDCMIGDHTIIGHGSMLGGHVHVDHHAILSGSVAVTHYASIGSYTFVGAASRVLQDVAPFMLADGSPARPRCINIVGLRRNNFDKKVIDSVNEAYRLMYRARVGLENCVEILSSTGSLTAQVEHLLDKIRSSQAGRHGRGREAGRKAA